MFQSQDANVYTKKLEVSRLKIGDILSHDVYLDNGVLLVRSGLELEERHIKKLKQLGNRLVTIDLSKLYQKTTLASQALMHKAAKGQLVHKEDVQLMMEPLVLEAFRENNPVLLLQQLQSQDEYTFQHTVTIGIIAMYVAKWSGQYTANELADISLAGTLHDIGKSRIPIEILNKPGPLTSSEYSIMRTHAVLGLEILQKTGDYNDDILQGVAQHHEREDGTGYPLGLKKEQIHPYAKIIAISDIYHAMTSDRIYKTKVNPFIALENLHKNMHNLDQQLAFTFINKMLDFLIGSKVLLSNGRTGRVIYVDKLDIAHPLVKIEDNSQVIDLKQHPVLTIEEVLSDN